MQEIDYLEQNKKKQMTIKRAIATISSIGGYMVGAILIGIYLDGKFFHNTGISVIIAALIGILGVGLSVVRLVINSRDN